MHFDKSLLRSRVSAKAFALVFLALTFSIAFQVKSAHAAPITISVSPSSAPVGNMITISGVNATVNGEVRFYVMSYLLLGTSMANDSGGYLKELPVPAVPLGTYSIMVLDVASGDSASTTFSVEPRILLTPTEGGYNDEISVRGDGFNSFSNVKFTFDGIYISPWPLTDFLGSFTASFHVPLKPNGTYKFTADDGLGGSVSTSFNVFPKLILWSTSGASLTLAYIEGYGFAPNVNVTTHFGPVEFTPVPFLTTDIEGSFGLPYFVPYLPDGVYTINATDVTGLSAKATFVVPGPILTLTPDKISSSSLVTARGTGFQPGAPVLLYLGDVAMTSLIDLLWMSPNLIVTENGSFEYSFIVPPINPGVYTVGAYKMPDSSVELVKLADASLTIVNDSPLDLAINVGSLHFRGEIAEFYMETSFNGKPVDVTLDSAKLYWNGTLKEELTSSVEHVATGLYRIRYSILGDGSPGTYTLVAEASYTTATIEAFGTSSGNFLLSTGFSDLSAKLIDLQGKIGTIVIPDLGIIKANLTSINAKLVGVDGKEAVIQSDIGTLTADVDTINARITSIDGNLATISSDLGTVKAQMTSSQPAGYQGPITLILSLIAAVGATLSLLYVRKFKPSAPTPTTTSEPPATPPSAPSTKTEAKEAPSEHPGTPPSTPSKTEAESPTNQPSPETKAESEVTTAPETTEAESPTNLPPPETKADPEATTTPEITETPTQ